MKQHCQRVLQPGLISYAVAVAEIKQMPADDGNDLAVRLQADLADAGYLFQSFFPCDNSCMKCFPTYYLGRQTADKGQLTTDHGPRTTDNPLRRYPFNSIFSLRPAQLSLALLILLTALLPASQPSQWISRGVGGGGALFSPSFSPHNPNELYVACDLAGLYHSTDLGLSWSLIDFRQIQANRPSSVQFTNDPSTLYCLNFKGDSGAPYKSTDGGLTWNPLISDPTEHAAYSLAVDGANLKRIVLSDFTRVYFSNDGGLSFTKKYETSDNDSGCHVAGVFFDGDNVYVGTSQGLLVSTDGGRSFAVPPVAGIAASERMFSFAGAKQDGRVRLFAVTLEAGSVYAGVNIESEYTSYRSVYALDWGQANWTPKTNGIAATHYPTFVSMAKGDVSTAYVAGGDDNELPIIYKSTDGGNNWRSMLLTANNQNVYTGWAGYRGDRDWSYGGAAIAFAVAPNDANKLSYTDLGFAHLSTDGGATWRQVYLDRVDQNPPNSPTPKGKNYHGIGLENTSCWWLTWSDPSNLFASFTDIRGIRSADGGSSWSFNYTGHDLNTMYQAIRHPASGFLYAATSSVHDMYQSTYLTDARIDGARNRGGKVLFCTDKGATWQLLHDFGMPVIWLAADAGNPNRLYASVIHSSLGGVFVSDDIQRGGSSTWRKLANPARTEGHPFNIFVLNDGTLISTYSGRRAGNPLAFTASSGVFISADGGNTWIDRSDPGMRYWTKDIVVDPHDSAQNTWYVSVFNGWGGPPNDLGGLYRTTNRGQSWTRIFNADSVESGAIDPVNAGEMYLTTEQRGLWYCSNLSSANPTFAEVLSYPFLHPVRVFFNPANPKEVWIASFGNGLRVGVQGDKTRPRRRP